MDGHNGFLGKLFHLVMNMDKMAGGDFERGRAALKSVAEAVWGPAGARHRQPGHLDTRSAVVIERQIPRDDHKRGRRLQSLERPGGNAVARRQHLR